MSWTLLLLVPLVLGLALLALLLRRGELSQMHGTVRRRRDLEQRGSAEAQLQHPVIDLSRCLGCATCVAVCPEDEVLDLVHGQAMVVNGARCVGVAACERECPVGAITVTVANLAERNDVPALRDDLEAVGSPGLFLAGEVTAHALIRTAIEHGTRVARAVAQRGLAAAIAADELDLCIVGAGPAGLACALEARRLGLAAVVLEQESAVGGTVAKYPRAKLVMTEPVALPLHGTLARRTYTKEQLIALWRSLVSEHELAIETGQVFDRLERTPAGGYVVHAAGGASWAARHVVLALGRRGVPNRLGVPGEELPKVAYSLLDARSFRRVRVLVVGGGDSAAEAAIALAEQPDNEVTLSYRKDGFFRMGTRQQQQLAALAAAGRLQLMLSSEVREIRAEAVELTWAAAAVEARVLAGAVARGGGPVAMSPDASTQRVTLANDLVFVMAGGTAPLELLGRAGVSFDPRDRGADAAPPIEQGSGLVRALAIGFALALLALTWVTWHQDYYALPESLRPTHDKHALLRPGRGIGLGLGITATVLVLVNLLYLVRRSPRFRFSRGSLRHWMTSHVATGILAVLCAAVHGALASGDSPGGHALWALVVLLVTGAIGRYFYAQIPRAANGRELDLAEIEASLGAMSREWQEGEREFRARARDEVLTLVEQRQWRSSFPARVAALLGMQSGLRRLLRRLERRGDREGIPPEQLRDILALARRAHRTALVAAHHEDLRAILGTWRYLHRWAAAVMVALLVVHIVHSFVYGSFVGRGVGP